MRDYDVNDDVDERFSGPPRGSLEDRLRRIARLRDLGALTAAEYERAKAKLLRD